MITVLIFMIVLTFAWIKPPVAIAMLLQTHIVRSLTQITLKDPCYHCLIEPDLILGAALPLLSFLVICIRTGLQNKKIQYPLDKFDALIAMLIFALFFSTLLSFSFIDSIKYSSKFILLALPFFVVVKLYFINTRNNLEKELVLFYKSSLYLALLFGVFALFIVWFNDENIGRITIPRVHPIPYSQLVGLGVLVSAVVIMTKKQKVFYRKKIHNKLITPIFILLLIIQLATNTRGVLVSLIIALGYLVYYNPIKIKKIKLYLGILGMLLIFIAVLSQLDAQYYFRRITEASTDQSILDRIKVYSESFKIFYETRFLGTGPGAFQYYSFLDYPHNLFLENLAVFGILGIVINGYIILLVIWLLLNSSKWQSRVFLILSIALFMFYFIETMFSFTLWMHKGLYLSMALVSVNYSLNLQTGKSPI